MTLDGLITSTSYTSFWDGPSFTPITNYMWALVISQFRTFWSSGNFLPSSMEFVFCMPSIQQQTMLWNKEWKKASHAIVRDEEIKKKLDPQKSFCLLEISINSGLRESILLSLQRITIASCPFLSGIWWRLGRITNKSWRLAYGKRSTHWMKMEKLVKTEMVFKDLTQPSHVHSC